MRRIALSLALLLGSQCVAAADQAPASGGDLRSAVSGRTVYIQTPIGDEIAIRYRSNGTMAGASSMQLAALAGESVRSDQGHWWVMREQLCQKWSSWSEGRAHCYKLQISGNQVQWSRSDGKSGTARLSSN